MSLYFSGTLCEICANQAMNVEQKIQEIKKSGNLPNEYDEDLRTIVTGQLPIVKALQVVTRYQEREHSSFHIYEMPDHVDERVRDALARIFEYIKGEEEKLYGEKIPYERWSSGEPTEAGRGWLNVYLEKHNLTTKNVHYKILRVSDINMDKKVEASPGDSAYIMDLTGLIVG